MTNFTIANAALRLAVITAALLWTSAAPAQGYYYPQYPQQPQYYPQQYYPQYPQHPQQYPYQYQQPQQPQQQPQPTPAPQQTTRKKTRDTSGDQPPSVDIADIQGPFTAYTWNYRDTLSDLAKAAGISTNQILALNRLSMSQLRDGQVLRLPALSTSSSLDIQPSPDVQRSREVWRGVRGKKRIALTFDAGGVDKGLDTLLKNLVDNSVKATFFATGKFGEKYTDQLRSIHDAGFPVYNHSWSHPRFSEISDEEIRTELASTDEKIREITGQSTRPYWRPPFGDRNRHVLERAAAEGYRSIYWTVDSLDSVGDEKTSEFVADRILSSPGAVIDPDSYLDGAIILMHVGETGTAQAIPQIVNELRQRGFTFVTVDEILQP